MNVTKTTTPQLVVSDVDIILYGTFAQIHGAGIDLEHLIRDHGASVGIYSWNPDPRRIEQETVGVASSYLSKMLTRPEVVAALERVMKGEPVIVPGSHEPNEDGAGDWYRAPAGLTPREAEILALITQGLSNQEIAASAFLSINSVKTYIRTAYRKIKVTRRSQAVLWGVDNGFRPDTLPSMDLALVLRRQPSPKPPAAP
jgi:NarL family two-component system response regulator LiaR